MRILNLHITAVTVIAAGWRLLLPTPATAQEPVAIIRAEVRLVEVFATVFGPGGRHVPGLAPRDFEVRDNGAVQEIVAFEASTARLDCAVLLDTTGSMTDSLSLVRNAVLKLIDSLRDVDSVAVYCFNTSLTVLQPFTGDRLAAKKAVMRTRSGGATALFDSILQVSKDLEERKGKRTLVVFTDGKDNSSSLTVSAAGERARKSGIPIYTVAQGEALASKGLTDQLRALATATGAVSFAVRRAHEVERVFEEISRDLQNTYMIAYQPPPDIGRSWREIRVSVPGMKKATVRARNGYLPK